MIKTVIEKALKNETIYSSIVGTAGLLIGSFFNYLLHFCLARFLGVSGYGVFNALLAVAVLLSAPIAILNTALTKISSELLAKKDFNILTKLFWSMLVYAQLFGIVVFFAISLLHKLIAGYLYITDTTTIVLLGLSLLFIFTKTVPVAYLQGLLRFKGFAFIAGFDGLARFTFGIILVLLGLRLRGVLLGLGLADLTTTILAIVVLKKNLTKILPVDVGGYFQKILRFSIPVFLVQLGMMALNNIDIILVKRYFSAEIAGYYSSTVTIGKILLFGAGTISTIMLPQISVLYVKGQNYMQKLKHFIMLQLLMVLGGITVYTLFAKLLVLGLFGTNFMTAVQYLPRFSLFIGLYVLINFMALFFLATERVKVAIFILVAVALQVFAINIWHDSLFQIININIGVSLILYVNLWVYFLLVHLNSTRKL